MKYGSGPGPAPAVISPIRLASGQVPSAACGSPQSGTFEVPGEPRRRRDRDPAEILVGVFAGERDPEGAVPAGLVGEHGGGERGVEARRLTPGDLKRRARWRRGQLQRRGPRRELAFCAVFDRGAFGVRARAGVSERRAGAAGQMQFQFAERQLRVFVERRGQLARHGVWNDRSLDLDEHAVAGERQIHFERRLGDDPRGRGAQVQSALQFARQRRRNHRHHPELRGVRALHRLFAPEPHQRFLTSFEPVRGRRRKHDARGHLHDRVLEVGRRQTFRAFGLRDPEIDFIARRGGRLGLFGSDRYRRCELQRFATFERADIRRGNRCRRALPRFDAPQFCFQRLFGALRRVDEVWLWIFVRDDPAGRQNYFWFGPVLHGPESAQCGMAWARRESHRR